MKRRSALITGSVDGIGFAIAEALARSGGVTVKSINPGLTDTPLARTANPQWQDELALDVLGKSSDPREIAERVLFLAGPGGGFMTGQVVSARMRYGA